MALYCSNPYKRYRLVKPIHAVVVDLELPPSPIHAKVIGSINGTGTVSFNRDDVNQAINMHFLGQKSCNKVNETTGEIESIEHENMEKVTEAQYNISENIQVHVTAELTESGELINIRIV